MLLRLRKRHTRVNAAESTVICDVIYGTVQTFQDLNPHNYKKPLKFSLIAMIMTNTNNYVEHNV